MQRVGVVVLLTVLCGHCLGQTPDLVLRIPEEIKRDTYIGNVSDSSAMFKNLSQPEKQTLKFGILNKDSHPGKLFRIDPDSGKLYIQGRIDREALCDFTDACRVEFDVAVHSRAFSNIATVHVYVEDINDNAPTFPATEVTLDVSELASVGTVLKISGAVDRDSQLNNTIQKYELSQLENMFSLTTTKNLDGSSVINLLLGKSLDREFKDQYFFNIIASDGGSPPKTGTLAVTINVIDENDNPPRFQNSSYDVMVKEDAAINSTVLVVLATDPDLGSNSEVRYQFSNLQSAKLQSLFSIDPTTGVIRVAGKLEYEPDTPYHLIVEALDSGDRSLMTQIVVTVTVLDSGNNPPHVTINTLTSGNTVSEAAGMGFFVAYVEVEDSDTGENGDVVCNISSTAFSLEPLSGRKGYKVLVNTVLDRESRYSYNMSVVCQDKGDPPLSGAAFFQMYVTDVNDNTPQFQRRQYNVSIPENSPIGYSVLHVSAYDADQGDNARLRYFVVEDTQKPSFRIQYDSGIITTNRKFDREVTPVIKFHVLAIDQGMVAKTGTTEVTLNISDINDEFPAFTHQLFQFRVVENMNANIIVGNITATDLDAGLNGEIEYFIAESPDGMIPFKVLLNGTVIAEESLDREVKSRYIFTVLARDKGSPPKTNSSEVSITVLDVNDNVPSILFPTTVNHTVFISRAPERDSVIGKIVAYDSDFGENSTLNFVISSGNADDAFSIDIGTGETKVANTWKLQNNNVYDLTITVHDSGTPQLKTETHLIIDVEFDNNTSILTPVHTRSDKYVIIAAVVAAATIILSIIIIAAICFVLRTDRRKSSSLSTNTSKFNGLVAAVKVPATAQSEVVQLSSGGTVDCGRITPFNGVHSGQQKQAKQADQSSKKKEVSFSIDDSLDSKPRDIIFTNARLTFMDEGDKILQLDDVHSDTSGETIPSDSGRGGSEEEVNIQTDKKMHLRRWDAPIQGSKSHSFDQCYPLPIKQAPDFQNSRHNQVRFLHTNSFHEGRDFPSKKSPRDMSRDYLLRQGHNTFQDRSNNYSRPLSYRRQSSNMSHDDDGSTTTSGSYTLNQEDLLEERILGKDVIV
ncbi:putative protocadherin beta-18 [Haliotis rufescens]|uniref:putative protocadherin beta-18 n=1 Tax=Haliotis rufescens TaxID=6454 RepID=UPI001EAFA6C0|nr:putative protocadherin beta-18 [Haliotis rufescens]XP_046363096.1 putative protocadherin beta-18 [Haliotis rufescens]XP_048243885.1 putative protocadherin beta-18 [Haliotis rufescens]